ncbi:MAG TPA: hypothetical protein VEV37_11685 [Bryobacteraceae bacterium]|nr:hypothetical protein [Bryobacteraceae bacterium]
MLLTDFFRSFLPMRNPIGFGASDFIELGLAALLLVLALISRPWIEPCSSRFARRTGWCMLVLAVLPVALRLILIPRHPVPTPDLYDEFGHLLVGETLRHFRLANPVHPFHRFFETFFVIQEPSYSSIYPIGQGLAMAIGRAIFGLPWAGVLLACAAFCSLCYWMLRAWISPGWALLGGLLAVIQFGPLNQWTNSYWGGHVAAASGCLVFGALPRIRQAVRARDGLWLGIGLALHLITRPYESLFLYASIALYYAPALRYTADFRRALRPVGTATLPLLAAVGMTLVHNQRVTHSWKTLPEALSQYQYGVPAALTFQTDPIPHRALTPQQELEYKSQVSFRSASETLVSYLTRLEFRVRFLRFFLLAPLYIALPFFLLRLREFDYVWLVVTILLFAFGTNFFPAFQFHYVAAIACLFILMSVTGLERLSRITIRGTDAGGDGARVIVFLCFAHFLLWYGVHLFDDRDSALKLAQYETWDNINHRNPERRIQVARELAGLQGRQLVFVRYWPNHIFQDEWVYNAADIDAARIVWARDLGASEDEKLLHYYPDRTVWLLEPDAAPPKLSRYVPEPPPQVSSPAPANKPGPPKEQSHPTLRFEQVH